MRDAFLSLLEFLYRVGLWGVDFSFRRGLRKVHRLPVPVVSVGNLTWGGNGKTPLVLQLAKALKAKGYSVAVLTRGYGQDEARLLTERLAPIPVLAGADRIATGLRAVQGYGANLLLLDDGYQQWRIKKDLEILAVDSTSPFGNGHLIPRGSLREPLAAARRADLIVVTKSDLNPSGLKAIEARLRSINERASFFFARYRPIHLIRWPHKMAASPLPGEKPIPVGYLRGKRICSMAGIARPLGFEATLQNLGANIHLKYRVPDHHAYTMGELIRLLARCNRHGIRQIVTTAKDAVRIPAPVTQWLGSMEILILEIELEFQPDESELLHRIDSLLAG